MADIGKTINTILNLTDKFTPKLTEAGRQTLIFKEQLKNCNSAADSIDKGFTKAAKSATAFGAAGAAAAGAFAASSLNTYKDFQQSMSNVAGILAIDSTSETYKKLENAAREAGARTSKNAQESADALSYMALAGWSVEDSMKGLMPILRASEATGADLAATSDLITDSMSALGIQVNDLNNYLDVCARAQNKSNTTLTQMQEAYIKCGGTFKTFNTDLPESAALLGVLANRGIKGAEAGTKLQSTLVNLIKKSGESYDAMSALGVSAYDSEGKFKGVTNTLLELHEKTKNLTEEQRNNYLTMIGGKEQLTTLNALMSGLTNTLENGKTEYEELFAEVSNCDGALEKMATTMTNNYAGALEQAGGAVDELKLTIGERLEPYITKFLNWFADNLPDATEKFAIYLDSRIPKAVDFFKQAFEKIRPVIMFVIDNFTALASAGIGVVTGLKAFSVITKVVSLMNKLKTAETALKAVQIALNTSMLASPVTWFAAAIGAVVGGMLLYRNAAEKAKEADIASHFGDIALSAEECSKMVENVFGSDIVGQVEDLNYAWDELDDSLKSVSDSANDLNKLTFMVEMNPKNVSKDEYLETAQSYIDNMQSAIQDKQFELVLDINFLFGEGSDAANLLNGTNNTYWTQVLTNAQSLGEELVANITKGYENGWDEQSMDMVAKSLQKMSEIQEKIQRAQAESQMELLTEDFLMSDLSQDSFDMYIEKLQEQGDAITEAAKTAAANAIASQRLMLDDGAITQDVYDANVQSITDAYQNQAAQTLNTVLSEGMNAIRQVYGDEFDEIANQLNEDISGAFQMDPENLDKSMSELQFAIENSLAKIDISQGTKEKLSGFLDALMPSANELQKMATSDQSLWKTYGDTLTSVEALKTLTGKGTLMGNAVLSGANSSGVLEDAEQAGRRIKEAIIKPFSETTKVTLNLDVSYRTTGSGISIPKDTVAGGSAINTDSIEGPSDLYKKAESETSDRATKSTIKSTTNPLADLFDWNATGTAYFGGGFTHINEHGGEIIDLPTGARIYPADKSAKMVDNKPNITVNVNIGGNIYGTETAANEIGEIVVSRIIDAIGVV